MDTTKLDGRTARLERNRAEIVRAQVEHVQETGKLATADEIAARANVSQRSVYRIFGDKAALLREAMSYVYRQLAERFPFPDLCGLAMQERICRLVDHLALVYEFVTPLRRVIAKVDVDEALAMEERKRVKELYWKQIRDAFSDLRVFGEPSPVPLHTFRMLASWNAWEYLRSDAKLSVEHAKEVVCHAVKAVLLHAEVSEPVGSESQQPEEPTAESRHRATEEGDTT